MLELLALGRWRQEDIEFKTSLSSLSSQKIVKKKNLDDCKKYIDLDNFQQSDHHVVFL